eukprot:403369857
MNKEAKQNKSKQNSQISESLPQNPFTYTSIEVDPTEWDNIPPILPKILENIESHLENTIKNCHQEFKEKQELQLPRQIENLSKETHKSFKQHDNELKVIRDDIVLMQNQIQSLFNQLKDQELQTNQKAQESMNSFVQLSDQDLKYESFVFEKNHQEESQKHTKELNQPRMYTMNQMRDLIYLHLNRSSLKQLVYMSSGDIQKHRQLLNHHEKAEQEIRQIISKNQEYTVETFSQGQQEEQEYRTKTDKMFSDVLNKLGLTIKEVKNCTLVVKQGENQIELQKDKVEKFRIQIVKYQETMNFRFREMEKAFDQSIKKNEDDIIDLQSKILEQLQDQAVKFDDIVSNNKEIIINEVQNDIDAGQRKIEELREELTTLLDQFVQDVERKIGRQSNKTDSITLQVENRFSKTNRELKKLSQSMYKLSLSGGAGFAMNSGNQQSNDQIVEMTRKFQAKLFSVETQQKEQDQEFKTNLNQLKNAVKQLITSLNQATTMTEQPQQYQNILGLKQQHILSKNHSPFTSKISKKPSNQSNNQTLFLPRLRDELNESSLQVISNSSSREQDLTIDKGIESKLNILPNHYSNQNSKTSKNQINSHTQSVPPFDSVFYKRLNHIQRMLNEDAVEMESIKNYFSKLSQHKDPNSDQNLIIESIRQRQEKFKQDSMMSKIILKQQQQQKTHDRSKSINVMLHKDGNQMLDQETQSNGGQNDNLEHYLYMKQNEAKNILTNQSKDDTDLNNISNVANDQSFLTQSDRIRLKSKNIGSNMNSSKNNQQLVQSQMLINDMSLPITNTLKPQNSQKQQQVIKKKLQRNSNNNATLEDMIQSDGMLIKNPKLSNIEIMKINNQIENRDQTSIL